MPFGVMIGGGPGSVSKLSKRPGRGGRTFRNLPSGNSTGVQWIRSSDVAVKNSLSPTYIQYLPLILVATTRPSSP